MARVRKDRFFNQARVCIQIHAHVPFHRIRKQPQLGRSATNRIGPEHLGWSGLNLVWEVRLKRNKFLIKFVLKDVIFSSGGYMSTL